MARKQKHRVEADDRTRTISVYEAKTHLSEILTRVVGGEEIVITRSGKPIVRLIPCDENAGRRQLGQDEGLVRISPDFDDPLPEELLKEFER